MRRILLSASALALFGFFLEGNFAQAQDKKLLATEGWGSLSGKVTFNGAVPAIVDLTPKMQMNPDKACCLDPKAKLEEKIDLEWVVSPKKEVANVVIWITPPKGTYFPLPPKFKAKMEPIIIDQAHCAFLPRVSAYNPINIIGGKEVATGQKVLFKNSAVVSHNIRASGSPARDTNSFNVNVPPKTEIEKSLMPQRLPIALQCDVHTWMAAKLYVFDHPYFAITKADGTFEIPNVPAGATVSLFVHHEKVGWVLPELGKGRDITLKAGKNVMNFEVKAP